MNVVYLDRLKGDDGEFLHPHGTACVPSSLAGTCPVLLDHEHGGMGGKSQDGHISAVDTEFRRLYVSAG